MQQMDRKKARGTWRACRFRIAWRCLWPWAAAVLFVSCASPSPKQSSLAAKGFGRERAIQVVQKSSGVFYYRFRGDNVLKPLEPYKDYLSKREITNSGLIAEIKALLKENESFHPNYKKRCLPKWKDGLEFRTSRTERRMILFSFSCGTMMIFEEKLYRDFDPQKIRLYGLLRYQINSQTSRQVK